MKTVFSNSQFNQDPSKKKENYMELFGRSITPVQRESFWLEQSKEISWITPPNLQDILKAEKQPFFRWFTNATLNISYNLLDRHIKAGKGGVAAVVCYCAYTDTTVTYTYYELLKKVNIMAKLLLDNGVSKGDRVIIYMPMIPEIIVSMLACVRIGAIHSVVFGGFAPAELADKIIDCSPKIIISASVGIEPRKKIPYFPFVVEALKMSKKENINIILVQRKDVFEVPENEIKSFPGKAFIFNDICKGYEDKDKEQSTKDNYMNFEKEPTFIAPVEVSANDPFYILYTSGTTGSPKGVVRDCSSIVSINYTMKNIMNLNSEDVAFSTGDIGWVVGHVFVVYGPLLRGATTIILEGKPVGTPDAGLCWNIIQKYKVKTFYTVPTALRAIKFFDPKYELMHKYDITSLQSVHLSGERCDPETFIWLRNGIGEDKLINDQWWQTETGYPICCNNIGIYTFDSKPGSALKPQPGFKVVILDNNFQEVQRGVTGKVCIELPLPPGFMVTLYRSDKAFIDKYISSNGKYYVTGDCGYFDEDGDIFIMSREDDMLKIAGHRLAAGRMEEVIMKTEGVVEAAVIPVPDLIKKELPFGFVILDKGITDEEMKKKICNDAKERIVKEIGAICRFKNIVVCNKLPKTKSGKIVRALLKEIANSSRDKIIKPGETVEEGEEVVGEIRSILIKEKII